MDLSIAEYPFNMETGKSCLMYTTLTILPANFLLEDSNNRSIDTNAIEIKESRQEIQHDPAKQYFRFSTIGCGLRDYPEIQKVLKPIIHDDDSNPDGIAYAAGVGKNFTLEQLIRNVQKIPEAGIIIEKNTETAINGKIINIVFNNIKEIFNKKTEVKQIDYIVKLRSHISYMFTEHIDQYLINALSVNEDIKQKMKGIGTLEDSHLEEIRRLKDARILFQDFKIDLKREYAEKNESLLNMINILKLYAETLMQMPLYEYLMAESDENMSNVSLVKEDFIKTYEATMQAFIDCALTPCNGESINFYNKIKNNYKDEIDIIEAQQLSRQEKESLIEEVSKKHFEIVMKEFEDRSEDIQKSIDFLDSISGDNANGVANKISNLLLFMEAAKNRHGLEMVFRNTIDLESEAQIQALRILNDKYLDQLLELHDFEKKISDYVILLHSSALTDDKIRKAIISDNARVYEKLSNPEEYVKMHDEVISQMKSISELSENSFTQLYQEFRDFRKISPESQIQNMTTENTPSSVNLLPQNSQADLSLANYSNTTQNNIER